MSRPRILIADAHRLVAELCKRELDKEFDIVGTVADGHEMVRAAIMLKPDVIVVDISMPILNGLDAGKQVKESLPWVKLVYLTMNTDPELALEAFQSGASAYLLKSSAVSELVRAVRRALRGYNFLCPTLEEKVEQLRWQQRRMRPETERLTQRQREVCSC
jgi:DNA-binding NarL/FixJ family response regulator